MLASHRTLRGLFFAVAVAAVACGGGGAAPRQPLQPPEAPAKAVEDKPVAAPDGPPAPRPGRRLTADEKITTAAGASFTGSAGWTVDVSADRTVAVVPEGDLTLTFVAIEGAADRAAATTAAWAKVQPGFARKIEQAIDVPAREGWDALGQTVYVTSTDERRAVIAVAMRKGTTWHVVTLDGTQEALSRRGAQLGVAIESFTVPGLVKESFAGKPAHTLDAARLAKLTAFVEQARAATGVPGAAVAIVQGDKIVYQQGFGVRELGKPAKVTPRTRFMIGSITKSLTTIMMSRLVDAGTLTWDTPVISVLPSFALADEATTRAATIRHTVCACTGMPRQDLEMIFEYGAITPEARLASMATMRPTTAFGETFQYSNLMVSAGGFAAAHARSPKLKLGPAYAAAMQALVFDPLGMKSTTMDFAKIARTEHATPHADDLRSKAAPIPVAVEHLVTPVAPAGAAWSTVLDLAQVMRLELGKGKLGKKRVVSEENLLARRAPQVKAGDSMSYGLGLGVGTQSGLAILTHSGGTAGFSTSFSVYPEVGVGIAIFTNSNDAGALIDATNRYFLELLFDGKAEAADDLAARIARAAETNAEQVALVDQPADPAWLASFDGAWSAPGLGRLDVRTAAGATILDAGEWRGKLGKKVDRDGTAKLIMVDGPLATFEITPRTRDGKTTLVIADGQQTYVFERIAAATPAGG